MKMYTRRMYNYETMQKSETELGLERQPRISTQGS